MGIRLLGPIEVWDDADRLDIGSAKSCPVLAALTITPSARPTLTWMSGPTLPRLQAADKNRSAGS